MIPAGFKGAARSVSDFDFGDVGRRINVGEDEIRAVVEVESAGTAFDKHGRPKMLFEPHIFWRDLGPGNGRVVAEAQGLAYSTWRRGNYPADSYSRLERAMKINADAALRSASWGFGQIMGFNHKLLGYASAGDMVAAFCDSEKAQIEGIVSFVKANNLDDELRNHEWRAFARGYNGPDYAANGYHTKLEAAFYRWRAVPDYNRSPAGVERRLISMGNKGWEVKQAQALLLERGFDPKGVDGIFFRGTRDAVIAFQKSRGLTSDGIIGQETWGELLA